MKFDWEQVEARLRNIQMEVDEMLLKLKPSHFTGDAINWADLRCSTAYWMVDVEGNQQWSAIVEECSPNATNLENYITEELLRRGYGQVEVNCEW